MLSLFNINKFLYLSVSQVVTIAAKETSSKHSPDRIPTFLNATMLYLVLIVTILIIIYLYSQRRPKNYPPGPWGIPILGHLTQLGSKPYLTLHTELREKYGPIVAVDFGSYPAIGISDYRILREVLNDATFAGRPNLNVFQHRSKDIIPRGLLFTEGHQWMEQRRFAIRQLKDLGYARSSLETLIQEEIVDFINILKTECDHPISLKTKFHASILSIIWSLVVGERGNKSDVSAIYRMCTKTIEENNALQSICMFVPWFAALFPKLSGLTEINKFLDPIHTFFEGHIDQHRKTFIQGQVRDFLDAYIQEVENTKDPNSSFYKEVGEKSMLTTLLDLFFAGGETTANTLHWSCLYLAVYPDIQRKIQEEIENVVGSSRLPLLSDENDMPYTWAVIQEISRKVSLTPLAIFHSTTEDTQVRGYKIPKDTMILMNIYSALNDEQYWGDPQNFRPERHLDKAGRPIKHDPMIPFGFGKRVCIGEVLARNEIFLWLTALLQAFNITVDPANPNPSLEPIVSWILLPPDHHLIFKQRK